MAIPFDTTRRTSPARVLFQPVAITPNFKVSSLKQLLLANPGDVSITNVKKELVLKECCAIETKHHVYGLFTAHDGTVSITTTTKPLPFLKALWRSITRIIFPQPLWKNSLEESLNCEGFGVRSLKRKMINEVVHEATMQNINMHGEYSLLLDAAYKAKDEKKLALDEEDNQWFLIREQLQKLSDCIIDSMKVTNNIKRLNSLDAERVYLNEKLPSVLQSLFDGKPRDAYPRFLATVNEHRDVLNSIPGVPEILKSLYEQLSEAAGIKRSNRCIES